MLSRLLDAISCRMLHPTTDVDVINTGNDQANLLTLPMPPDAINCHGQLESDDSDPEMVLAATTLTRDIPHDLGCSMMDMQAIGQVTKCLFDSGSTKSFIHPSVAHFLKLKVHPTTCTIALTTKDKTVGTLRSCLANITVGGKTYTGFRLLVMPKLCAPVHLGLDFQCHLQSVILAFGGPQPPLKLHSTPTYQPRPTCGLSTLRITPPALFPLFTLGCKLITARRRRYCTADRDFIKAEVRRLLAEGVIEPNLNLVDWNAANLVAIALSNAVYLWHPEKGIHEVIPMESGYISSLAWIKDRNSLAIGTSSAQVQLWDIETMKKLRNLQSHCSMVGALSWNDHILTSGSRFGSIHHHDVRIAQHHVGSLLGHDSQVCSLKWSPDGEFLASGGNDGLLNIWHNDPGVNNSDKPDMTINHLESAVKAMNWCPWQSRILAVGGGMKDGHLRIWDTKTGSCIKDIDTRSQICSLLWLPKYKELITGHGFPKHQVSVWNYPSITKLADLKGHRGRVLHLTLSPDGNVVFSTAADETACLWNCLTTNEQTEGSSGEEGTLTL
ncbi:cell division cycle protein 20 homolog [Narcine bancroftii]|uniref:cell division cycle protein 20 homolog n=1 Tax=Narcine bancroftii TaxID=1343680 RepID=UPI003831685D